MRLSPSFQVVWEITVHQAHRVIAKRKPGFFSARIEILVDNQPVGSFREGAFKLKGHRVIRIDEEPVDVHWKRSFTTGILQSLTLQWRGEVLARYPGQGGAVLDSADITPELIDKLPLTADGPLSLEQFQSIQAKIKAEKMIKSASSWFYAIGGLSVINSLIFWFGGGISFLVGLAMTQVIDAILTDLAVDLGIEGNAFVIAAALAIDAMISGLMALFGLLGNKRKRTLYIGGMVLYALDGLIFLAVGDFASFAFHLFALFGLARGVGAMNRLREMERERLVEG